MQQQELEKLMSDSAHNAVQTAREEFAIELDYSAQSIRAVDDLLLAFVEKYQDKALEDSAVFTLCNIYGAYLGETYRRLVSGEWRYDQTNPDAPFVVLDSGEHSYAFAGICYERLVNDSHVSVKAYFDQALQTKTQ
ncbi:hypothetical protein [Salinimonas sediminis]|uniref:DUF3806 domain-containing protein n=1 Tax=Salinimonas sediminis TaxID=2303538 RepID=A0A346NLR6_9ALTE|nr:hypothetical protein [Salinimonas sediminis]AXR06473.1 hypothetical protein D0Y50_08900 [Salinimonas sediminis]